MGFGPGLFVAGLVSLNFQPPQIRFGTSVHRIDRRGIAGPLRSSSLQSTLRLGHGAIELGVRIGSRQEVDLMRWLLDANIGQFTETSGVARVRYLDGTRSTAGKSSEVSLCCKVK